MNILRTGLLHQQLASHLATSKAKSGSLSTIKVIHNKQKAATAPHAEAAEFIVNAGRPAGTSTKVKK